MEQQKVTLTFAEQIAYDAVLKEQAGIQKEAADVQKKLADIQQKMSNLTTEVLSKTGFAITDIQNPILSDDRKTITFDTSSPSIITKPEDIDTTVFNKLAGVEQ